MAADLERGLVLVIDYGHRAPALYDPARVGGTLRAYAGQRAHADPFIAIGRQDLTAHVDLTALEAAAQGHGLDVLGDVSQAEFLVGCGLEELVERVRSNPATTIEEWLALRSAIARLLDPAALGGFRAVLARARPRPDQPVARPCRGLASSAGALTRAFALLPRHSRRTVRLCIGAGHGAIDEGSAANCTRARRG